MAFRRRFGRQALPKVKLTGIFVSSMAFSEETDKIKVQQKDQSTESPNESSFADSVFHFG